MNACLNAVKIEILGSCRRRNHFLSFPVQDDFTFLSRYHFFPCVVPTSIRGERMYKFMILKGILFLKAILVTFVDSRV